VPVAYHACPEFAYVGSARGKLALIIAFLVAGASGVAVFTGDPGPDSDPMNAMALASPEESGSATSAARTGVDGAQAAKGDFGRNFFKASATKSPCQETFTASLKADCTPGRTLQIDAIRAINDQSAATAPSANRSGGPALLPSPPINPIAALNGPDDSQNRADVEPGTDVAPLAAPAASPTSAVHKKKKQARAYHVSSRNRGSSRSYSSGGYQQSGYARLW